MKKKSLPDDLEKLYQILQFKIKEKLEEFRQIKKEKYFYELCFCICTPNSKAENATIVQRELEELNFQFVDIDPTSILRNPKNYIRFHNQKAKRLINLKSIYSNVLDIINSDSANINKRNELEKLIPGIGLKEASHYLRNIGFRNLAILDRHILSNLNKCGVLEELELPTTKRKYLFIEKKFLDFAIQIGIPIDELDLLFWAEKTGKILK